MKYLNRLKNNIFYQNVAVVTGGNAVAKGIGILAAPVITRLYSPEDYGIFSVIISITGIAGSLATLRYAVTIPLAKDTKLADNLLKLCFLITISISIFLATIIFFFGGSVTERFSVEKIKPFLWVLPVVLLGQGFYEALSNWAVREKRFKLLTETKITQGASSAVVKIGLGVIGIIPLGLLVGHIAQEFAGIGRLLTKFLKIAPAFFKNLSFSELKDAAFRYKEFPLIQSWSQLILSLGAQLPLLLIGVFFGAEVAGVYGLAYGIINLPMNLIGQSVSQVYFAEISNYGRHNPTAILRLSKEVIKKLFWIGLLPVCILILIGPWLFEVVFGLEWRDAGIFASYFSIFILTRFVSSPITSILNVYERQDLQLMLNIIRIILVILVFGLSHIWDFTPSQAVLFYGIVFPFYSLAGVWITLIPLRREIKFSQGLPTKKVN